MGKVLNVIRKGKRKKIRYAKRAAVLAGDFDTDQGPITSKHLLISMLLPSSVKAFIEELEKEVEDLSGKRYAHGKSVQRWGNQNGSIVIGNQHVAIEKPRLRKKDGSGKLNFRPTINFKTQSNLKNLCSMRG